MALRPCIECRREISTDADPCPLCGKRKPHAAPPQPWPRSTKIGLGILLGVSMIVGTCQRRADKDQRRAAAAAARAAGRVTFSQLQDCMADAGVPLGRAGVIPTKQGTVFSGNFRGDDAAYAVSSDKTERVFEARVFLTGRAPQDEPRVRALGALCLELAGCLTLDDVSIDRVTQVGSVRLGQASYRRDTEDGAVYLAIEMNSQ